MDATPAASQVTTSPLLLADHLLRLAADADRAGLARPARRLLHLANQMWNERPDASASASSAPCRM